MQTSDTSSPSRAALPPRPPATPARRARWSAWADRLLARFRRPARPPAPPPADGAALVSRAAIERLVGHPVGDLSLYERALRHRSVLRGVVGGHLQSNERLEFLGDAVLGLAVAEALHRQFSARDEGFLTRTRAKLVNGPTLARFAEAVGLPELILVSANMDTESGRHNPTILADAFEALLGALYLDLGFDAARSFVLRVLEEHIDVAEVAERRSNYKSLLLEFVQARGWGQPQYVVLHEEGPSHARTFTIEVQVEGTPQGAGVANSKKKAEQQAAREALQKLRAAAESEEA